MPTVHSSQLSALNPMKPGDLLDLTIEAFADRGKSLARMPAPGSDDAGDGLGDEAGRGYVVFVAGAVPGDRVRAVVLKRKRRHAEARLVEVVEPSPLRVAPRCEYFGTCGGCKWQHVDYAAQLEMKRGSVEGALRHAGGFADAVALAPIASPRPYFYRNKMEFSFADARWLSVDEIASEEVFDRSFALGLHAPGSFEKVLDLERCYLQSDLSVALVNRTRALAKAEGWAPYGQRSHEGFLRHLVIRHGEHTGETMVNVVTNGFDADRMATMANVLQSEFPAVTTFVCTVHTGWGQTAIGERVETIYGPGVLRDRIGDLEFEIAPNAFFQTNTRGAEALYAVARSFADLRPDDLVYDLYCGAGTISLFMAPHVRHVVGVELVPEAIDNARANALRNGIANTTFHAGDLLRVFTPGFVEAHGAPDVLVLDPPRAGVHPKVMEEIARLAPERLVYVSCNPQTQARDLALLQGAYRLDAVQPVDMFPHTDHVENVARLTRAG